MSEVARSPWPAGSGKALCDFLAAGWRAEYSDDEQRVLVRLVQRAGMTYPEALAAADRIAKLGQPYPPKAADLIAAAIELRVEAARVRTTNENVAAAQDRRASPPWYPVMVLAIVIHRGQARAADRGEEVPPTPHPSWDPFVRIAREAGAHPGWLCSDDPAYVAERAHQLEAVFHAAFEKHGAPAGDPGEMLTRSTRRRQPGDAGRQARRENAPVPKGAWWKSD